MLIPLTLWNGFVCKDRNCVRKLLGPEQSKTVKRTPKNSTFTRIVLSNTKYIVYSPAYTQHRFIPHSTCILVVYSSLKFNIIIRIIIIHFFLLNFFFFWHEAFLTSKYHFKRFHLQTRNVATRIEWNRMWGTK